MSARLRGLAWAFVAIKTSCAGSLIARANEGCAYQPSDQRHRCSLFRKYIKQQLLLDKRWLFVLIRVLLHIYPPVTICIICLSHAREPLYPKDAAIPWWLQSTSAQKSVPSCLKG